MLAPVPLIGSILLNPTDTKNIVEVNSLKPIDVLGAFGGFLEVLTITIGVIGYSYSER